MMVLLKYGEQWQRIPLLVAGCCCPLMKIVVASRGHVIVARAHLHITYVSCVHLKLYILPRNCVRISAE